jgi:Rrf2 family transcriptional regulator, nitric oxide-sensitive transcriptional repressor
MHIQIVNGFFGGAMQLTLFADYSLRTLMYLATHEDRLCTSREISDRYGISKNHVVKIVHKLSQLGYIKSVKGKGGGIGLLKKPSQINLRSLITALETNLTLVECFDAERNTCKITAECKLKKILRDALKAFLDTLGEYTLDDLVINPKLFYG